MKQSILFEPQHSRLEERSVPAVGPRDVLVKVKACGVCASELHGWRGDHGTYPRQFGHEVAGEVVEVGPEVEHIRPGDRVTGLFQQGFAEYARTTAAMVTPIPANVGYDEVLGEPISCVISAARRTRIEYGDTVAIVGLGFMGLLMLQAIRHKGAARIIAIDVRPEVLALARQNERPLLTGEIGVVEDYSDIILRRYPQNNAVLINAGGEVVGSYAKIHLVPFGEWFPYEKWLGFVKRITESMGGSSFVPGDKPKVFEVGGRKFGVLICYEGISQRLCRTYRAMGAEYFVNITNDGWTDTFRGHMQHFSASKFRAVENGIWYLRAGNTGYTAFIDPYGRIRKSIPILKKGFLVDEIDFSLNHRTLYALIGDLFLYLAMAFVIALAGIMVFEKVRSSAVKK